MSKIISYLESSIDALLALIPRSRPSLERINLTKLIAHRGAHSQAKAIKENTHKAFERAQALGCWGIELDVLSTADGVLVVHHDLTLERLWGSSAAISDLSFQELQCLAPEIPRLEEVVARYGKILHLFIELKAPSHDALFDNETALSAALAPLTAVQDYHLLSLEANLFEALSSFPQAALLLVPVHHNVASFCALSLSKQYGGVLGHYLLLTDHKISQLRQAGQDLGVGMVNSKFSAYREINRGIEWLFTDKAEEVMCVLRSEELLKEPLL